jgi:hypothetical protein
MKLFFTEFPPNYAKYHFPYQILALREKKDNPHNLYLHGFLPFRSKKNLYYLARSTRVNLKEFTPSSENRRILRKTEKFTLSLQPLDQFNYTPQVQKFCSDFVKQTFGKQAMPTAAIRTMFNPQVSNLTHVFTFHLKQPRTNKPRGFDSLKNNHLDRTPGVEIRKPVGYIVAAINHSFLHYDHPFYDIKFAKDNLGIGMMTQAIQWAAKQHKAFVYLGTCYTKESLYKTQFAGFQFFTGYSWSTDLKMLKALIKEQKGNHYLFQDKALLKKLGISDLEQLLENEGIPAKLN